MKSNIGSADKVIRILVAITVILLYLTQQVSGTTALVLLIVAGAFILTSVTGFCPLYWPFHSFTLKKEK